MPVARALFLPLLSTREGRIGGQRPRPTRNKQTSKQANKQTNKQINLHFYKKAKHGLIGLTRSAAIEGGKHGITANALCPSYVRTPLVQEQISDQAKTHNIHENEVTENIFLRSAVIKKIIEPDEVANVVKFLCSDDARSITGANWTIDAGWTAQ